MPVFVVRWETVIEAENQEHAALEAERQFFQGDSEFRPTFQVWRGNENKLGTTRPPQWRIDCDELPLP